ncbi:hypothetical protein O181_038132 [Austropuccinia psidii MF-1]|uniref:CCHC-type domain-containing protein n=1 Tax=Austropuccinia psidii MF-1 TaxID=1389203 RepID=A0A9Q3HBL5_9BASI|nr:hypothetical protein [Austropuccinia psidii MF-1]
MEILRKCGGELENYIKLRCVEPFSTEYYISAMEYLITQTRSGKTWKKDSIECEIVPKTSRENRRPERHVLKCHKCGRTSHLANTCTKQTKINQDNEPLGTIRGHEADINLNIERPYPPVLRRTDYPESPRASEALERHIQELMQLVLLRKVGYNEEVEVTTSAIIPWHNDKSRMVEDFEELNTYTVTDRYTIPSI